MSDRVHAKGEPGRAYCGRKAKDTEKDWKRASCEDCLAARRADAEASRRATA